MRLIVCLATVLVLARVASAQALEEAPELGPLFREHGVQGTFVLFDRDARKLRVWNEARAKQRFVPASTFKIANSLIGLNIGAVKSVDEVLPYGGKPQRFKHWERDMSLREAMKASAVPIYQGLARRVGLERMREGVQKLGYGNREIGSVVDRFWLDGPLAISAVEQAEFLARLVDGTLPVSADAVRAVKEITLLEKGDGYSLHGKTGWAFEQKVGWWVGWVERDGTTFPFALNIDILEDTDAEKRIPVARACLKMLGKL